MKKLELSFSSLQGKTLKNIFVDDDKYFIVFTDNDDNQYELSHDRECCEQVYVESICGDLQDLIGEPLLVAEESSQDDPDAEESATWTFYKLSTRKGYVTIRFYGSSNGAYSEAVTFYLRQHQGAEYETRTSTPDKSQGSPYDCGSADSYYGRPLNPHWYPCGVHSPEGASYGLTPKELAEYNMGYWENERTDNKANYF